MCVGGGGGGDLSRELKRGGSYLAQTRQIYHPILRVMVLSWIHGVMYREQLLLSYYAYEPGRLKRGKSAQCVQIQALSLFEALPIDNNHVTRCAFRLFLQVW